MPTLYLPLAIDVGIQVIGYIISASLASERFYDLSGATAYIASISALVAYAEQPLGLRQGVAAAMGIVWATRLGAFLFHRVLTVPDRVSADDALLVDNSVLSLIYFKVLDTKGGETGRR